VIGLIKQQWALGQEETKQIPWQCKYVLEKRKLTSRRLHQVFVQGKITFVWCLSTSPWLEPSLFSPVHMSISMRLCANQWTTANCFDQVHPQLNVDKCMDEAAYI
jgi:hypothetical protein